MAKLTSSELIASLKEMSIIEIHDLIKAIETEFGVSAAAPVAAAGAGVAEEVQTEFSIKLTETGPNKVAIIKIVREITGLGLMEAKNAVDNAPTVIKEDLKTEEANEMKKKFEDAGAKVELI